jgi:ubiquitin-activating enzyme E1
MKVLLYGMRGIGMETAKNLTLQGAGALTIVDSNKAESKDVGVNFFIHEEDIILHKTRAEIVLPRLKDLNPTCVVNISESLTDDLIKKHSVLVITEILPLPELIRLNELCRSFNISFLYAHTGGVSSTVFIDHGINHYVNDFNGQRPIVKLILNIKPIDDDGNYLILYDHPEGAIPEYVSDGNYEITEVNGMDGLNGQVIQASHPYSDPVKTVRFNSSTSFQQYISGGILTEKKLPTHYPMLSLSDKVKNPGQLFAEPISLVSTDLLNFGSELQQHVAFISILKFYELNNNKLPRVNNIDDANSVVNIAKNIIEEGEVQIDDFYLDEKFVFNYSLHCAVELQPMSAFIGGVLGQEVVKVSGKFTPIPGFLHFSANEALPDEKPIDIAPRGHRNDELAAVYGWTFVENLGNLKYFMVGCGALGCEFMKNFALNSVCCGPDGQLTVTDADRIEISNLTRQFLFREHNVGQPKSTAAAAMASVMNPKFIVDAQEMFVGTKTESSFNDEFWMGLDGVCNALDNMEARNYVDSQCVKYEKSLLESGTMGTNANVDTICPHKTRTYRDGGNAAEGGDVPMCTLRNFPQITDHCIEWSRDQFELLFVKLGKKCESYQSDPSSIEKDILILSEQQCGQAVFEVRSLTTMLYAISNPSIENVAQISFDIFHFLFRDKILDLQLALPADARIIDSVTKEDKGPFWGEKKRFPSVASFDINDDSHVSFLISATCLFAVSIGVLDVKDENDEDWAKEYRKKEFIMSILPSLTIPEYIQSPLSMTPEELKALGTTTKQVSKEELINGLLSTLRATTSKITSPLSITPAEFEKDDDINCHISFINSSANLRCDNYSIKRTDFQSTKIIAGKIIAAIATTTAAVCGLVMLELFKILLGKPTDSYMNRQIGLATNVFTSFTQEPPIKIKTFTERIVPDNLPVEAYNEKGIVNDDYIEKNVKLSYPEGHSIWDKIEVPGNLTLKEFSDWLAKEHNLKMLSWDFVYGQNIKEDSDGKKMTVDVTTPVFPTKVILDSSNLPPLDSTMAQAMKLIMSNPASKSRSQEYISLWRSCKSNGVIPPNEVEDENTIKSTTTLIDILSRMDTISENADKAKLITSRSISDIKNRSFWIIPGKDTPSCTDINTGDEVAFIASLKITL